VKKLQLEARVNKCEKDKCTGAMIRSRATKAFEGDCCTQLMKRKKEA
jgi:hypothetical protein